MNPHITLLYNPILRTVLMSYPRPPNMHTLNLTLLLSSLAVRVGIITKHNYVGRNNMWVRGGGWDECRKQRTFSRGKVIILHFLHIFLSVLDATHYFLSPNELHH